MARPIDIEVMRECFDYDPLTGGFTYKTRPATSFVSESACSEWNARYAGRPAGSYKDGYLYLYVDRKNILAHRVAWALMTDAQPPAIIDHRDRDRGNNRWSNLRDGTAINCKNRCKQRNNSSGLNGVGWHKKAGKWAAYIRHGRKNKHLGLFEDKHEAARVAREARAKLGFSPTHGM